jgi:uncharacterized protein YraI
MGMLAFSPTTYAQAVSVLGQNGVNFLSSNSQSLPAGTQHWYRFDYAGGNQQFSVSLDVTPAGGGGFQVWTVEQVTQLASNAELPPLAVGTADVNDPGHIEWIASFAEPESYYVVVEANADIQYILNISGLDTAPSRDAVTTLMAASTVNLNVRTGPSTNYPVIRTVPIGTQMSVLGQDATSGWLFVQFNDGTQGWVAQFLTTFIGTAPVGTMLPLAQPPLAPPPVVSEQTVPIPAINVNVRTGPATTYPVIRSVPAGTEVTILGQDATGTWLLIQLSDGIQGWMARFLTNFTGSVPTIATQTITQPPLAPPTTVPTQLVPSVIANSNVRSGPATTYPVIRIVTAGTQISVLGQDVSSGWLFVQFSDGVQGWIARWLTNYTAAVPTLSVQAPVQPPLAPPATTLTVQPDPLIDSPVEQALGRNWRTLQPGQIHWYVFDHPGDETEFQVWLDSEPNDGAGFRLMNEHEARAIMDGANPDDISEFGAGTPNPNESGDLFWEGDFVEHGRFYVMVTNSGQRDIQYSVFGTGPSVSGLAFVQ